MSKERFKPSNSAMLLIDHQDGTMGWVHSAELDWIKTNTVALAKSAAAVGIPLVLTTSMEEAQQGPLFAELRDAVPEPFNKRVKRAGMVNCMDDEAFSNAVRATDRKNLIMAGITTDVCVVYPAISAVRDGYNVQVVVDASGSPTKMADDIALRRMENEGVVLTTTNQLVSELAHDWSSPDGEKLMAVLYQEILSKGQ